jgi:hypothetical protein
MQIHYSDSSYQAKAILGAWRTGDEQRLREELERAQRTTCDVMDSGEAERRELLSEIARELRASNQPLTSDASEVCCNLLEHLALSGGQAGRRRAAILAWPRGPVAAATVLQ